MTTFQRGPKPRPKAKGKSVGKINLPKPPGHLSEAESQEFNRVANLLQEVGTLSEADVDAIALYAKWHGSWTQASAHVTENGQVIKTSTGAIKPNPSVGIANTASREMLKCLNALGMTPASRKGVEQVKGTGKISMLQAICEDLPYYDEE